MHSSKRPWRPDQVPGGFAPADPLSPSLAGPRDPRSAPAGAPVARLASLDPGGFAPADPLSPSFAGPHDPRSAPAGAPVARLARYAASPTGTAYKVLVSSRITGYRCH